MLKNAMSVGQLNYQKHTQISDSEEYVTMVRYNDRGTLSTARQMDSKELEVSFLANVRGIAPGQSAVLYQGEDVVLGGIILRK